MTKILFIVTQSELGGAQRYIFDLATNLDKSQYDVHIAHGSPNNGIFSSIEAKKLTIHGLKHLIRSISPINDIKAYFELKNLIKSINPNIVHLNSSKAGILGSLAAKACKVTKIIYTAHGFVFNEPMNPIKRWIYKRAEISNAKRVDAIICVSEFDRQTGIKAGMPENKLITIHNGIDPDKIEFLPKEAAILSLREASSTLRATKQSYQRDEDTNMKSNNHCNDKIASLSSSFARNDKLIGCIANFYRTKGLDILIKAMEKVDAKLILIGDGVEKQNLQLETYNLKLSNKIFFTGLIPNASKYLKAFNLFVLASRKEGLPYALLEACAAQVPIVATKVGGTAEIIQDGMNGYLAEPENPDDLADKINFAIKKPLSSKLENDFGLETMLIKTIDAYKTS